ncbi:hypothetical protein [Aquiflexum gelatinilyticum]|uniref:Uncharacterized protein n=1 Tax=Aquiflexum gelatinilyticum TaxID=2961943 RepID=A0A9X2P8H7_9BACT|nr:hypothetical protein [Aquiflexum gelatinilyticum]MCR9016786.1 hypothetical protein [Aquiflexum gelatinilyticum]
MKIFDREQFIALSKKSGYPFVSIYTPTSRLSTTAYKEDKTHFKNQLQEINSRLTSEKGLAWKEAEKILAPANELLDNDEFWEHNSDMLAVFLHDGEMEVFQLPLEVAESSHFIGSKPMLLPMIPELSDDGHYYLLLLNLDHIYLYEATRNGIQEIDDEDIASSFTEDEEGARGDKGFQARGAGTGSQFHGHSENSDEERKKRLLQFFHRVNNKLVPVLNRNPLPLYLAGVEYLAPIYREANSYGYLMEGKITGAFNHNDMMVLHAKSWEVAAPYFETERLERKSSFGSYLANGLAVNNDKLKLIKAALTGAVDTLLVDKDHEHLWGTYDESAHQITLSETQEPGMHCLIDEAAARVIDFKGKVYLVETDMMPDESSAIAGILRYPL